MILGGGLAASVADGRAEAGLVHLAHLAGASRGHFHFHSFQGSFFPENLQKPRENAWFLEKNDGLNRMEEESTARVGDQSPSIASLGGSLQKASIQHGARSSFVF